MEDPGREFSLHIENQFQEGLQSTTDSSKYKLN